MALIFNRKIQVERGLKTTLQIAPTVFSAILYIALMPACGESPEISKVGASGVSFGNNVSPSTVKPQIASPSGRADEECCTDPGAIAACWWQDAERDGVVCLTNQDCGSTMRCNKDIVYGPYDSTPPNGWGLCGCDDDSDCQAGEKDGVCTEIGGEKVCGPSYCNGFMVCACFGGCTEGRSGNYPSPKDMCSDTEGGFPGECCESDYPSDPDGESIGFCSNSCDGSHGSECEVDEDCVGPVPDPYSADCTRLVCDNGNCNPDPIRQDESCADNVRVTSGYWGIAVRDEASGIFSCFEGKCSSGGRCLPDTQAADGLTCDDDDDNTCTDEVCLDGVCEHDSTDNVGDPCSLDDDACTLDKCSGSGACETGEARDCDDENFCTYPDTCEDNDPDHLEADCVNPAVSGNAEDFGYTDADDCVDLLCINGAEIPTATDCTGSNPLGVDLQCNEYVCTEGGGEDNCGLSYLPFMGDTCTDGDACTVGDRCYNIGGKNACVSTGNVDCGDSNPCTQDSCVAGSCVNTPNTGAGCDDGNPCTLNDTCNASGSCVPGTAKDCSSLTNSCTTGVCNTSTGTCQASYLAVGTSCDADSNPCTLNDACNGSGTCVAGAAKDCSASADSCNNGVCNTTSGLCQKSPVANGNGCNADNNACTVNDNCQAGVCTPGAAVSCAAFNNQCNVSVCNSGTGICQYQSAALVNQACNLDSNGCTTETCQGAANGLSVLTCTNVSTYSCDDGNACTGNTCTSTGNYTYTCSNPALSNATSCNADNNGCTSNDHCNGSGACVAGTTITASACQTEILTAHSNFDLYCNTAKCQSTGNNTHSCAPVPLSPAPAAGSCNADNNGCTLDTCSGNDAVIGASCAVGTARNCSALTTACQTGVCTASNYFTSSCTASYSSAATTCNFDSNGCTVNDHCNGSGTCVVGAAATCTPSDACHTTACASTGNNAYSCNQTQKAGCCVTAADCVGKGFPCEGTTCSGLVCTANVCGCAPANVGAACADLVEADYPENCYAGTCDASGNCVPGDIALTDVPNNLCSDLFDPGTPTQFLSGNPSYIGDLGSGAADGSILSATGSTLCGYNNYRASAANNCIEDPTGFDLGVSGNDVAYGFRYWTPSASDREMFSYVVKVESDFDSSVYIQDGITSANACPEGNNPSFDDSSNITTRGMGYISYEIWTGVAGSTLVGMPPVSAPNVTGFLSSFEGASNYADSYMRRIRGYLIAPTTGAYTFWIASDEYSELYLSTDNVLTNKSKIAYVSGTTNSREWTKFPAAQKSLPVNLVAGTKYYIEALHKEASGNDNLAVGWARPGESTTAPSEIIPGSQLSPWDGNDTPAGSGTISCERWTGVSGTTVASIPVNTTANETDTFNLFEGDVNYGNNYGQRIRGYLTAPYTGVYTFFVAADAQAELWLSPNQDPVNKVRLVQTSANAASRVWTTNADQKSAPVNLVRGERYYIEGLHKEGSGNDNFAVGWAKPGESTATASEVIPGAQLSPWDNGPQSGFGYLSYEWWNGIAGTSVASIPVGTTPSSTDIYTGIQDIPSNAGNNYGQRIRGYIYAPLTGNYTFWIASDETSELWISTDDNPANKVRVANCPAAVATSTTWTTYAAQKSAPIPWVAYHYYYVEILHKEGSGSDFLNIAWSKPGQSTAAPGEVPVNKFQLAPWGLNDFGDLSDPSGNICFDMWFGKYATIAKIPVSNPADIAGSYLDINRPNDWNGSSAYAQRIRGFLIPPTTGNYTFWVSADDLAELWLSTNSNPVNKVRIAYQTSSWASPSEWNKYASQKSSTVALVANQKYYIEVLHTETAGLDHIQVGWAKPGQGTASPSETIPGTYFDPLDEGCGNRSVDVGWVCSNPYSNTPMPPVVEEECFLDGDALNGQTCCDPCTTNCYNDCRRGYLTSGASSCNLCSGGALGTCNAVWDVQEEPFGCESELPADPDYSMFTDMSLAVIKPKPVGGGAWRNAVIFVDGSNGETGNFYLTVEKRKQSASPCERVGDNPRIVDVTKASASGDTYNSTIENLVNSRHVTAGSTACGGYNCTDAWAKDGTCHSASTANAFWPSWEGFVINRAAGSGSQTYCITASPTATNGLDPVLTVMSKAGATRACKQDLAVNTCQHANYLSTKSQVQLTASAGTLYLIEVSRYNGLQRPCLNASGDKCDFTLTVKAGTCP
jgi:hypothetical protein